MASNNYRIPWYLILSCILVTISCSSWIFFLEYFCSLVLLNLSLAFQCEYMQLLLFFIVMHLLLCRFWTPGIFCSHTFMDLSRCFFTSLICTCLFISRSNLFQMFWLHVFTHITYNYQINPGSSTSTVSYSCDWSWKGYCDLKHFLISTC